MSIAWIPAFAPGTGTLIEAGANVLLHALVKLAR